jgi:class 3 adenylate cyclase
LPAVSERTTTVEAPPEPEGERKMLSALFADIKGSTALMEDLDPEEARAIIDPALRHMIDAVHRYQGYVVQSTGDGIFALFGAPIAYEDHPQRALYAALQMRDALREYGARLAAQAGPALEARIGVNTGEVVVRQIETSGRTEYTPIGHTANLAARTGCGAGGLDRDQRADQEAGRGLLRVASPWGHQRQGRQRSRRHLRGDRSRSLAHAF